MIARSLAALVGDGDAEIAVNAGPYARDGVPALGGGAPSLPDARATVEESADGLVLANGAVRLVVDARGLLTSVRDLTADRELVPPGAAANLLQLHRDTPTQWDAWDIDEHYRRHGRDLVELDELTVLERGPERAAVRIVRKAGASTITQVVALLAGSAAVDIGTDVDWHERQKLLKLAFPLDVHADRATSEIQFGHLHRPTHTNTSWDAARFETVRTPLGARRRAGLRRRRRQRLHLRPRHRPQHAPRRGHHHDGAPVAAARPAVPRSQRRPGPRTGSPCRCGSGATIGDAVAEGYRLNLPLRTVTGAAALAPLLAVDHPAVVVEAVKLAEDGSGDVVVRLYEAHGGRATARVTADFPHTSVVETDLLEAPLAEPVALSPDGGLTVRPFQIVTLRFAR